MKTEDQEVVERVDRVRGLVRRIEEALAQEGYTGSLNYQQCMEALAALSLVYDGRARCMKDQKEIDKVCESAMFLAGSVSHASRVVFHEQDAGTIPDKMPKPGVIRL